MPFDLSEDQLRVTETEIGARFPESYRQAMMRSNGGEIHAMSDIWNLIPLQDTSNRKRLSRTANHVIVETRSFSQSAAWPENAYIIADDGTGDALILFREGRQIKPQVFYWFHEGGDLQLVAEDFSDLLVFRT